MQNQPTDNPIRNACMLIGVILAFSSIGGIIMPLFLGLPQIMVICGCVQMAIGLMLAASGWFCKQTKALWVCILIAVPLWLANTCVFLFTFFLLQK